MSMRLVKQQLAALSSKASSGSAGIEEGKAVKKDPKNKGRKRKRDSSLAVKQVKKQSKVGLTEEEIKTANLEYLRKSQPAEKSVELMNKVDLRTHLTRKLALQPFGSRSLEKAFWTAGPGVIPCQQKWQAQPGQVKLQQGTHNWMDSYWRAPSLHGIAAQAHGCSLPPLRAFPSAARARKNAVGHTPQVHASAASGIHNRSSACHSAHSAPTHWQGPDVSSHCGGLRAKAASIGAASGHGSLLHASQTTQPFLFSDTRSPQRRAFLARPPARGSVAASAGSGSLMDVFQAIQAQMQGMAASDEPPLADVNVSHVAFHPAGRFDFHVMRA